MVVFEHPSAAAAITRLRAQSVIVFLASAVVKTHLSLQERSFFMQWKSTASLLSMLRQEPEKQLVSFAEPALMTVFMNHISRNPSILIRIRMGCWL